MSSRASLILPAPDLDLGVVGNCQVAALIDRLGSIVWMCLPRPDGDPVFCSLLRSEGANAAHGSFDVEVADLADASHAYVRNTAILETTLRDSHGGTVRITDFCPRFSARGRFQRPMMLVRLIEATAGRPVIRVRLHPSRGYGARPADAESRGYSIRLTADTVNYRVTTNASLSAVVEERPIGLDRPLAFILGPDEAIEENPLLFAQGQLAQTLSYWQEWVRALAIPYDWQQEVIRAAITLKLCTFEDTGAVLAALTTSIPEAPHSGRNWDYRYCWLRDSYFVIQALNRLGATRTMESFLQYLDHIVVGQTMAQLQPLYTIGGGGEIEESILHSLDGYLGMGPVRVGNQAAKQAQHDVYGAIILAVSQLFFDERLVVPGDQALFLRLEHLGERAAATYDTPDAGPWELRGRVSVHTFSAAMSWAGCDRLARIAARLGSVEAAGPWRQRAAAMRERILASSWSERRRSFAGSFGGDELDATALLLAEIGLVSPQDPRFHATVEAAGTGLLVGDYLYRYRHADDFGEPETAFTICSFWYVNALASIGRVEEAREHFSRLLRRRNPLGLLSEDLDTATGALWGNYPQTYSMVGIINSAVRLSRSWEEAF
jgi:GH15 family glucan-1,4-alpha-glucosidase